MQLNHLSPVSANRLKGIVVDFRTFKDRNGFVEQPCQLANDAALGLATQAEEDQVVPRQNRVHQLRDDRFIIANDARK